MVTYISLVNEAPGVHIGRVQVVFLAPIDSSCEKLSKSHILYFNVLLCVTGSCSEGHYSLTGFHDEQCYPCPRNFYQPAKGQFTCLECDADKVTTDIGQTSIASCQPYSFTGGTVNLKKNRERCKVFLKINPSRNDVVY